MDRPHISASIDDLETALEEATSHANNVRLDEIAFELTFRKTSRARELALHLGELRAASRDKPINTAPSHSARGTVTRAAGPAATTVKRRPTAEQEAAIAAFRNGGSTKINAYAGTGKTSTLELIAHASPKSGQYIAFNRSIVAEAKGRFPTSVNCSTTHGLAFRATPTDLRTNSGKMTGKTSSNQLAEILGLTKLWRVDKDHSLQPRSQAFLILDTIRRFAQSADDDILPKHVPHHGSLLTASLDTLGEVERFAVKGAKHVWGRMTDHADLVPLGHDGYLKLWALSRPQIASDFILLDEAQDTNPAVLEVLRQQSSQLVYVGDRYQQIYEWRGAVNAMEQIATEETVRLTLSFRFGRGIADAASRVLAELGEGVPLTGNADLQSRVGHCEPRAILARTNASAMTALVEALNDGRKPHLVGGNREMMEMLRGVQDLKEGNPSTVAEFFGFQNWDEVVRFTDTPEGEHLLTFVNLVQSRGERQLMWALNRTVEEEECDLVISTAHKAKGREWRTVRLMDDFLKSRPARVSDPGSKLKQEQDRAAELRLFYVALTRARDVVDIPDPLFAQFGLHTSGARQAPGTIPPANEGRTKQPTSPAPTKTEPWAPPSNWSPPQRGPQLVRETPPAKAAKPTPKKGFFRRLFDL
ncbi:MAG: DNA helicase [Hyphomicrobiales bacterium]|nr:MAG: DNA helicase [Hyphomicrobiales bacterium]